MTVSPIVSMGDITTQFTVRMVNVEDSTGCKTGGVQCTVADLMHSVCHHVRSSDREKEVFGEAAKSKPGKTGPTVPKPFSFARSKRAHERREQVEAELEV